MVNLSDLANGPHLRGNPSYKSKVESRIVRSGKRKPTLPNGYYAPPGTGPEGETCKTCRHIYRKQMAGTFIKCQRTRHAWTGGAGSDIRAKSPACAGWEAPDGNE